MAMNMMNERKRNLLQVMVLIQLVIFLQFKITESANKIALPGCQDSCGGIPIPYPFGIGLNCALSVDFQVTCNPTYSNGTPTSYLIDMFPILNISLSLGQAPVGGLVFSQCYNTATKKEEDTNWSWGYGPRFWFNTEKNKFTIIGCNTRAYLHLDLRYNSTVGCITSCDSLEILSKYGSCSGIGCCQTAIPKQTSAIKVGFEERSNLSDVYNFSRCSYAMVVEEAAFMFQTSYITTEKLSALVATNVAQLPLYESRSLPVLVNWVIENTTCNIAQTNKSSYACRSDHSICSTVVDRGYICNCNDGYEGNPYLDGGCQDIDECAIPNACSQNGKCHNFEGGYRCSCSFGWLRKHNKPKECYLNGALVIGILLPFLDNLLA